MPDPLCPQTRTLVGDPGSVAQVASYEAPDGDPGPRRPDHLLSGQDGTRQQRGHAGAVAFLEHEVGMFDQRRHRVGHCHPDFGYLQERQIVLGIADGEDIVR